MYKSILLPTDGSRLSGKAVKQAIKFARSIGAKITALHVMPEFQMIVEEGYALPSMASLQKRFEEETAARAKTILEQVRGEAAAAGVDCRCVSVAGSAPWEAITKQAGKQKCDLIMMASHGRKGLQSLLLGSETTKVLVHSKIPVLVVR
jgi:nucleotide-binding universal stress UspA family protein